MWRLQPPVAQKRPGITSGTTRAMSSSPGTSSLTGTAFPRPAIPAMAPGRQGKSSSFAEPEENPPGERNVNRCPDPVSDRQREEPAGFLTGCPDGKHPP